MSINILILILVIFIILIKKNTRAGQLFFEKKNVLLKKEKKWILCDWINKPMQNYALINTSIKYYIYAISKQNHFYQAV